MGSSKLTLTLAAASSVSGLVVRDPGCTFTIKTGGAVEYPVGQHSSGQTRAGANIDATEFTLANSSLTDSQGRGCWWTPPTKVLQCDVEQVPEPGFEVGCDGTVSYNGASTFWECDAGEKGEVNIYLEYDETAQGCNEITLTANGCKPGSCEAPTSSAPVAPTTESACETVPPSTETVYSTVVETVTNYGVTVTECASTETYPQQPPTETYPQQPPPPPTHSVPQSSYQQSPPPPPPATSTPKSSYPASPPPPPPGTSAPQSSYPVSSPPQLPTTSAPASSYPVSPPPSVPSSTGKSAPHPQPSGVAIPGSCPGDISSAGELNLPTLIIPVDSSTPNTAAGTSYFGEVNGEGKVTAFDFNIPQAASGKTCNLVFLFPKKDELETSDFTFSGSGALDFTRLDDAVNQATSYANLPGTAQDLGQFTVAPGNAYDIASFDCPAGEEVSFKIAVPEGGNTALRFFQDYNPCPIGLFITTS